MDAIDYCIRDLEYEYTLWKEEFDGRKRTGSTMSDSDLKWLRKKIMKLEDARTQLNTLMTTTRDEVRRRFK